MTAARRSAAPGLLVGIAAWLLSFGAASAYLTDGNVHPPPDYGGPPPSVGGTYVDPIFGTGLKRLSDALDTPDAADRDNLEYIMTEYSTMSAFSNRNSRLILQHGSYFGLYDGNGSYLRDLPLEISASSEPRWSRRNARVLYYILGNRLMSHDVDTGATADVRVFSEYSQISGRGESDICFDGDHFVLIGDVLIGDDGEIFVYEVSTNSKGPVLSTGDRDLDSLYITPDDNVTVTWLQSGSNRYNGIELFDRGMQFQRQLTAVGGHMDVTRDTNGDEVLLWASSADPTNPAPVLCDNGLVKVRLSDARQTCLIELDWSLAIDVSAPDKGGWAIVATYAPTDPDPSSGEWHAFTNELLQVRLDGSQVRRLAHHRSRPFNGYNYTPRPTISRDGSRLVFSSNFGLQETLDYPADYADAYLIRLAPTSRVWIAGGLGPPVPSRPALKNSSVGPTGLAASGVIEIRGPERVSRQNR